MKFTLTHIIYRFKLVQIDQKIIQSKNLFIYLSFLKKQMIHIYLHVVPKMQRLFFMKRKRIQFINFQLWSLSHMRNSLLKDKTLQNLSLHINLYKALSFHCCYKHL